MSKVRFEPFGITVESHRRGEWLPDILERAGISLETVCGGRGKCGRCRVIVREGSAPVIDEDRKMIRKEDVEQGNRLPHAQAATDGDHVPVLDHGSRFLHRHQFITVRENSHCYTLRGLIRFEADMGG